VLTTVSVDTIDPAFDVVLAHASAPVPQIAQYGRHLVEE